MPIHKATIVPRGDTLGMVAYLPEKDQMNLSKDQVTSCHCHHRLPLSPPPPLPPPLLHSPLSLIHI